MCYKGVTEGKIEKEGKMSFSIFIFIYTIHLAYLKVYTKFENIGSTTSQEIFIGEKEKWTNKGTDMLYVAVFLLHISSFVPNFRILSQVVAEDLWQKKISVCII